MIVIPELRLVVLQPPRTGSTSLRAAIQQRFPQAVSLFRHLERDGIPQAYCDFDVACMIREPLARLHSVWRFMRTRDPRTHVDQVWATRAVRDASAPFEQWLTRSRETFTYRTPAGAVPHYHGGLHATPIARKSALAWARPDLGPVELIRLEDQAQLEARFDLSLPHMNAAKASPIAALGAAAQAHLEAHFSWDLALYPQSSLPIASRPAVRA